MMVLHIKNENMHIKHKEAWKFACVYSVSVDIEEKILTKSLSLMKKIGGGLFLGEGLF